MRKELAALLLAGALFATGCGGDGGDASEQATDGFVPVRVGASGFAGGAPQPAEAGSLSVTKVADGGSFFARVEDAGGTDLPEGENAHFRLAGVVVPDDAAGECLAGASTTHLRGIVRGAQQVRFVFAEDADPADEAGIPVHVWSRGLWVNGEVLARGYGRTAEDTGGDRREELDAAQAFAQDAEQAIWNPSLCDEETPAPDESTTEGAE